MKAIVVGIKTAIHPEKPTCKVEFAETISAAHKIADDMLQEFDYALIIPAKGGTLKVKKKGGGAVSAIKIKKYPGRAKPEILVKAAAAVVKKYGGA